MTYLEVAYRIRNKPTAPTLRRLADLRSHYGIVQLHLEEEQDRARVVYDASRLNESDVLHLLRLAGLDVIEKIELSPAA